MEHIAFITGASRGIGKELAIQFAKNGHDLILVAYEAQELEELKHLIETRYQRQVEIFAVDLAVAHSVQLISSKFAAYLNQVEYLVNNAGIGLVSKFEDMSEEDITALIEVNITAVTKLALVFMPIFKNKKRGSILNVASIAAFNPGPYMAVYYATKAYVLSFSQALYQECLPYSVHVATLCPGITKTAFIHDSGMDKTNLTKGWMSLMTPQQVADTAYKGLMKKRRMILPGWRNKLSIFLMWLFPSRFIAKIIANLEKPKLNS